MEGPQMPRREHIDEIATGVRFDSAFLIDNEEGRALALTDILEPFLRD